MRKKKHKHHESKFPCFHHTPLDARLTNHSKDLLISPCQHRESFSGRPILRHHLSMTVLEISAQRETIWRHYREYSTSIALFFSFHPNGDIITRHCRRWQFEAPRSLPHLWFGNVRTPPERKSIFGNRSPFSLGLLHVQENSCKDPVSRGFMLASLRLPPQTYSSCFYTSTFLTIRKHPDLLCFPSS